MDSWIEHYYNTYYHKLNISSPGGKRGLKTTLYNRHDTFLYIFERLLERKKSNFHIIETGTLRNYNNWKDGNSSVIFHDFVKRKGGSVKSVDIDENAVCTANNYLKDKYYTSYCKDSVLFLKEQTNLESVDLFYLDSYDVKWKNDENSAWHHLQEFLMIEPYMKNCIICIDDNAFKTNGQRTGKGRMIFEYLYNKNILPVIDDYQIIYEF